MSQITSIHVDYKHVDGWHVFSSKDLPGLYVAHADAETAFNDVTESIEKLVFLDTGVQCHVAPEMSFSEFMLTHAGSRLIWDIEERIASIVGN